MRKLMVLLSLILVTGCHQGDLGKKPATAVVTRHTHDCDCPRDADGICQCERNGHPCFCKTGVIR
jgi:hypothetical protein